MPKNNVDIKDNELKRFHNSDMHSKVITLGYRNSAFIHETFRAYIDPDTSKIKTKYMQKLINKLADNEDVKDSVTQLIAGIKLALDDAKAARSWGAIDNLSNSLDESVQGQDLHEAVFSNTELDPTITEEEDTEETQDEPPPATDNPNLQAAHASLKQSGDRRRRRSDKRNVVGAGNTPYPQTGADQSSPAPAGTMTPASVTEPPK